VGGSAAPRFLFSGPFPRGALECVLMAGTLRSLLSGLHSQRSFRRRVTFILATTGLIAVSLRSWSTHLWSQAFAGTQAPHVGRLVAGSRLPYSGLVPRRQARIRWTSEFLGVTRHEASRLWQAHVPDPETGEPISLGLFHSERDAAKAYDQALLHLQGPSVATNYPKELYYDEDIEDAGVEMNNPWRPLHSSKYNGVYRTRGSSKWRAEIEHLGVTQFIGEFDDEEEAARAADAAVRSTKIERMLQLRKLNFKLDSDYFDEDTWEEEPIPNGMTSRFMGVTFHAGRSQFLAKLGRKHIDLFDTEYDAAKAYDAAAHAAGGLTNFRPSAAP